MIDNRAKVLFTALVLAICLFGYSCYVTCRPLTNNEMEHIRELYRAGMVSENTLIQFSKDGFNGDEYRLIVDEARSAELMKFIKEKP